MIVELIILAVPKNDINYNRLKYYLEKPKLMSYFIKTDNQDQDKIKFYDPLYSNLFIRERSANISNIFIDVKFQSIETCEVTDTEISWINKGFAKYGYMNEGKDSYIWKQCGVKENKKMREKASVSFTCFENKCNIKLIIL